VPPPPGTAFSGVWFTRVDPPDNFATRVFAAETGSEPGGRFDTAWLFFHSLFCCDTLGEQVFSFHPLKYTQVIVFAFKPV